MDVEVLVVGAGVVGLAVAAELGRSRSVLVVERRASYALETSSHNSGVIHSGIYYPTGSWKHRLCIEGNRALYAWCETHGVPHRRMGKLIVATETAELERLDELETLARANGVPGLTRLTRSEAHSMEPAIPAMSALHSPGTGIVDQMALARSLEAAARVVGVEFAYRHRVTGGERTSSMFHVKLLDADGIAGDIRAGAVVNAAGHGSPNVAERLGYPVDGDLPRGVPALRQRPNRGRYYDVVNPNVACAVNHLVYPAPTRNAAGLGVHITLDLDRGMHLGPDAEWLDEGEPLTYQNDDSRRDAFLASARRLLPPPRSGRHRPRPGRLPSEAQRAGRGGTGFPALARPGLRTSRGDRVAGPHGMHPHRARRGRDAALAVAHR